eukprot:Skav231715  [mRNA]  locus=scaffold2515:17284:17715:+ [translate_table: standard]
MRRQVWNLEGEIYDYFPGDDLEFHVAAEVRMLTGRTAGTEIFQGKSQQISRETMMDLPPRHIKFLSPPPSASMVRNSGMYLTPPELSTLHRQSVIPVPCGAPCASCTIMVAVACDRCVLVMDPDAKLGGRLPRLCRGSRSEMP